MHNLERKVRINEKEEEKTLENNQSDLNDKSSSTISDSSSPSFSSSSSIFASFSSMYIRIGEDELVSPVPPPSAVHRGREGDEQRTSRGVTGEILDDDGYDPSDEIALQMTLHQMQDDNETDTTGMPIPHVTSASWRIHYFQWVVFSVCTAMLIALIFVYRSNWNQLCDINLKIWSLVWLIRWNLQIIINITITLLKLNNTPVPFILSFILRLNHIFGFTWWLFGVDVLFFQKKCNFPTISHTVCNVMFWTTAVLYMLPFFFYLLLCLCLPCIIYFFVRFAVPTADRRPTPNSIIEQLEVKTYGEIAEALHRQYNVNGSNVLMGGGISSLSLGEVIGNVSSLLGSSAPPQLPSPSPPLPLLGSANTTALSSHSTTKTHSSQKNNINNNILKNSSNIDEETVNKTMTDDEKTKLQLHQFPSSSYASTNTNITSSQPSLSNTIINNTEKLNRIKETITINKSCPICMVDMDTDDEIMVMPCDNRHFFHKTCVTHWLETSQVCPICRDNIVHRITGASEAEATS